MVGALENMRRSLVIQLYKELLPRSAVAIVDPSVLVFRPDSIISCQSLANASACVLERVFVRNVRNPSTLPLLWTRRVTESSTRISA